MLRDERQEKILAHVNQTKYASMDELIRLLGISKSTVRRDLLQLSEKQLITLTRGGVMSNSDHREQELVYEEKRRVNVGEKDRIARAASELVLPDASIILDAGTTVRAMTPYLRHLTGLNLVTNDIQIAADLASCDNIDITVTGGKLRKQYYTLLGFVAERLIRDIHVDIAFLACDAVNLNKGCCMITNLDELVMKQYMVESAHRTVLLCDHLKFTASSFISICPLGDIDVIITGRELPENQLHALRARDIEVILV